MKNIAILSILLLTLLTGGHKNDYIAVELVGDGNKPLIPIYISTKPIPREERIKMIGYSSDYSINYIVASNEFLSIKKQIISTPKKVFEEKDYGGIIFRIRENDSVKVYFVVQKKANSLLTKLNSELKHDKQNKDFIFYLSCFIITNRHFGPLQPVPSPLPPQRSDH